MSDLAKINNFCKLITKKDRDYPNSLKSLVGISDKTRGIMLKVIKKYQKGKTKQNAGYVETELIRRFLDPAPFLNTPIKEVEGPVALYQMSHPNSKKYPRIFYLIGDVHVKQSKCPGYSIVKWIHDTIVNSPCFIDVYLESPYHYKKYRMIKEKWIDPNTYLMDMYYGFEKCFKKQTMLDFDVCQTSRFHYTDIRKICKTRGAMDGSIIFHYKDPIYTSFDKTAVNKFIDYLINKESIIHKRIQKQFDNIIDKPIRTALEQSFQKCQEKYLGYIRRVQTADIGKNIEDVIGYESVCSYQICLMDYYLMGRCFRNYEGDLRGAKGVKYRRPSYNNIIYTGDLHTENYVKILTELGFKIDFKDINEEVEDIDALVAKTPGMSNEQRFNTIPDFQCLDVSKMKQPMFHQRYKVGGVIE